MSVERVTVAGGTGVLELNRVLERNGGTQMELPQSLRIALATGQLRRPLAETLRDLLALLVDGCYQVDGPARLDAGEPLVPTATWPPDDEARVAYYRTAIRTGHRPVAVVLSGTRPLILVGHHKIAAYEAEGVRASAVVISEAPAQYSPS